MNYERQDWKTSPWYRLLNNPLTRDPITREGKLFRRRFRVPFVLFRKLYDMCLEMGYNEYTIDVSGRVGGPLSLKLLGVLRFLGRGVCFDGISELSYLSEETHRTFFHTFCKDFSTRYLDVYCSPPKTAEEIAKFTGIYNRLGFPGCIGSTDCVHVRWDMCPALWRNVCTGKEGYPTLVWQVTVDHHKKIISTTRSHFGSNYLQV